MVMPHLGEIISLVVAVFWTVTALFADKASHRLGSMSANVLRLSLAVVFLGVLLWVSVGRPYPVYASGEAWVWLGLSALVGYVFGDWCLFNCYLSIGARFGQLFMTLAPPMAAIAGWAILGETLTWKAAVAMVSSVTTIWPIVMVAGMLLLYTLESVYAITCSKKASVMSQVSFDEYCRASVGR